MIYDSERIEKENKTASSIEAQMDNIIDIITPDIIDKDTISIKPILEDLINRSSRINTELPENRIRLAKIYSRYALVQRYYSHFDSAIDYALKALAIYEEMDDTYNYGDICNSIGVFNMYVGNYMTGISFFNKALEIAQNSKDPFMIGRCLNNLGYAHISYFNSPEQAYPYLLGSLRSLKKAGDSMAVKASYAMGLNLLCDVFFLKKDYYRALAIGLRSIDFAIRIGNRRLEGEIYISLGNICKELKHFDQAFQHYIKAFEISKLFGFFISCGMALYGIGELYYAQHMNEKALLYLNQAVDIFTEGKASSIISRCLLLVAGIYEDMGKKVEALAFYKKARKYQDRIWTDQVDLTIKSSAIIFNHEQTRKESEIYRLRNIELRQENEARKEVLKQLRKLSSIDLLTQIRNRFAFLKKLSRDMIDKKRKYIFGLMIVDIDDFKMINDKYGRAAGDFVIVSVAGKINRLLLEADNIGRYDGGKFIVYFETTSAENGTILAERIRVDIEADPIRYEKIDIPVTVSVGVGVFLSVNPIGIDELLEITDEALNAAKQKGKNCVETVRHSGIAISVGE